MADETCREVFEKEFAMPNRSVEQRILQAEWNGFKRGFERHIESLEEDIAQLQVKNKILTETLEVIAGRR